MQQQQQPPEKSHAKQVRGSAMSLPRSKIIERVMQAISALANKQGSSTKDILSYVTKNSRGTDRNLTLKVQQALKQSVRDGKIKLRSGRYKIHAKTTADPTPLAPVSSKSNETRSIKVAGGGSNSQRKRTKRASLKDPPLGKDKAATNQTSTKSSNTGSEGPNSSNGIGKKNKHQ